MHNVLPDALAMTLSKLKVPENLADLEQQVADADRIGDDLLAVKSQVRQRKTKNFICSVGARGNLFTAAILM